MTPPGSPAIQEYFASISRGVAECYELAVLARKQGFDPEDNVPIPLAKNMAERVVGLISVVAPQLGGANGVNITQRILELEKKFGLLDWRVGLIIAEEVAKGKFYSFPTLLEAAEVGIRVGFAYLTLGIVSAPLEGFIGVTLKRRKDGREYFALRYAGPIRGAGGTAASTSVVLADYIRVRMGYAPYDPEESEVNRAITEVHDYHERVTNLQYFPSEEEIRFMVSNLPVEVDGDPTEKIEVSNHKDLPRIQTNRIRGGMALVLAEGLCQKAPKLWKRLSVWGGEMGLQHWKFIPEFIKLKEEVHARHAKKQDTPGEAKKVKPNNTFISDIVAGRPVLTHPLAVGGFRLRYGRTRASGFSACALHSATLIVLNKYIAIGTQLKVERPGKAATVTVCDALEGPIFRLRNGSVIKARTEEEAKQYFSEIEEILFLGDILFNYGDFSENGHPLVPAGYCPEWWAEEVEAALESVPPGFSSGDFFSRQVPDRNNTSLERGTPGMMAVPLAYQDGDNTSLESRNPLQRISSECPPFEEAVRLSLELGVPLHPEYTYYWSLITAEEFYTLAQWLREAKTKVDEKGVSKIVLPYFQGNQLHGAGKKVLENLGVPHLVVSKESVVLGRTEAAVLSFHFSLSSSNFPEQQKSNGVSGSGQGFHRNGQARVAEMEKVAEKAAKNGNPAESPAEPGKNSEPANGLEILNAQGPITLRDKAGTFIGARMGRPEKAKMRQLTGSPQVLFPVGEEGDRLRSFQAALQSGKIRSAFPTYYCPGCRKGMVYRRCEECSSACVLQYHCRFCGPLAPDSHDPAVPGTSLDHAAYSAPSSCKHGKGAPYKEQDIDISYYFEKAKQRLGARIHPDLIKGVRGTSNKDHVVEHLSKGLLRAKHKLYVNKDGTIRYDATELPLTHFQPREIKTSIRRLRELGYQKDIHGAELVVEDQLCELRPQDLILPGFDSLEESAAQVLLRVTQFIDELLEKLYGLPHFYNAATEEDLTGHLVIGLAPHISAGMVGRIIGFSETQGFIAHPMFHAAMRRDCDGDESSVMLLLDALLNYSPRYLPETRGSTMDSPLVLTSILNPTEVDDQVHGIDVVWSYPLSLYQAALEMKNPWDVRTRQNTKIEQLGSRLEKPLQYEQFGFTHPVANFNKGVRCSAYKTQPSMEEKLLGQMDIAQKVRAVNMDDVAKLVIQKHFLRDIRGNLRKFSMQQFRCVKCNGKYRRPPLAGKCLRCGGRLLFTVTEGSVLKYLGPSLMLAEKYDFSPYLKQVLGILKFNVDNVFGKEKEKQVGLGAFVK